MAIANSMIIGHLEGQGEVKPVKIRIAEKMTVNSIANSFKFETIGGGKVKNLKHWYSDLTMIGRHFLLYSEDMVKIKRQYTICNSIVPHVYEALLKLCSEKTSGQKA